MHSQSPVPLLPERVSLVAQTMQSLRHCIHSGHWRGHLPGERELCDHLQVSRTTMRAALKEMQEQGLLSVTGRSRRAILLTKGASEKVAPPQRIVRMLIPSALQMMHPHTMLVIDSMRGHLAKAGCLAELHARSACFSNHPARALEKLVQDHPADAWVVFGSKQPMQRWFKQRRLPVLIFGSCQPEMELQSIDADHRAACHHSGGMLWRKGHRRIALILPRNAYGGELDSEQGLRSALKDMPDAQLTLLRHDGTAAHVCALLNAALRSPQAPTAFVVTHAEHALTVTTHLLGCGLRIPQDIAIVSRDHHAFLQSTSPAISHYMIDPAMLARRVATAARHLVIEGTLPAQTIRLMPKFVPGGTV